MEAVELAMGQPCPVTLYLYDEGGGFSDDEHFNALEIASTVMADQSELSLMSRSGRLPVGIEGS